MNPESKEFTPRHSSGACVTKDCPVSCPEIEASWIIGRKKINMLSTSGIYNETDHVKAGWLLNNVKRRKATSRPNVNQDRYIMVRKCYVDLMSLRVGTIFLMGLPYTLISRIQKRKSMPT